MKTESLMINEGLVFAGLLFATANDRARYIRTVTKDRPQWLKDNSDKWWSVRDIQEQAAQLGPPVESGINVGVVPAGPNGQMSSCDIPKDGDDDDDVALVDTLAGDCSLPLEPTSLPTPVKGACKNGTTKVEPLRCVEAATPVGATRRKLGRSGGRRLKKQKLPVEPSELGQKRSPERMRIILDSLAERPIKILATRKAGVHRNTVRYWLKCSAAGHDGYDVEWRGYTRRFHEHYEDALEAGRDEIMEVMIRMALGYDKPRIFKGRVVYKIDESLRSRGYQGADAYLKDENGNPIPETVYKWSRKAARWCLERLDPDRFGKRRKIAVTPKSGGVLVIGEKLNTEKREKELDRNQQIQDVEFLVEDDSEGEK